MSEDQVDRIVRAIEGAGSEVAFWVVMAAILMSTCIQFVKH